MVRCFAPCCNHYSDGGIRHHCKFYRFPTDDTTRRRWARVVGRSGRQPSITSRICSCHFPEGKERGPTLFKNKDGTICIDHKIPKYRPVKKPVCAVEQPTTQNVLPVESVRSVKMACQNGKMCNGEAVIMNYIPPVESVHIVSPVLTKICPSVGTQTYSQVNILLETELKDVKEELRVLKLKLANVKSQYTPSRLSDEVVKMETGLPDRDCFNKIVECATSLEGTVSYFAGWKVKCLSVADQVFLTLMKLRHSYKDFHLAALFSCSQAVIKNVVNTWTDIMQALLQDDYTATPKGSKAQKKQNIPLVTNPNSLVINLNLQDTNLNPLKTNPNSLDTNPNPLDTNPDPLDTSLQIESTSDHIFVFPSHPMLFY
ncbi:THAP domain-containing protein 11-like [Alosa sapidissima]|uniref:THAP domain-containing protein 11-like n=1 Tax=Alosa sapidissima TaxID=34773 RepID=UPI001C07F123|nr:THAP domain-containing protein 11-like [Alosa sapidissima]